VLRLERTLQRRVLRLFQRRGLLYEDTVENSSPGRPAAASASTPPSASGETEVATSIIVAAELRFGAAKRGSKRLTSQLEAVLGVLAVLPLESPADAVYGGIRARIEREGRPMGANDLLIAAHAISVGFTLVTDQGDFDRIPDLAVENWLR
jgi:tRNA(fMet)-specific endonuclease VapC